MNKWHEDNEPLRSEYEANDVYFCLMCGKSALGRGGGEPYSDAYSEDHADEHYPSWVLDN